MRTDKRYKVTMMVTARCELWVEAKSKAEARRIAEDTDIECFDESVEGATYRVGLVPDGEAHCWVTREDVGGE